MLTLFSVGCLVRYDSNKMKKKSSKFSPRIGVRKIHIHFPPLSQQRKYRQLFIQTAPQRIANYISTVQTAGPCQGVGPETVSTAENSSPVSNQTADKRSTVPPQKDKIGTLDQRFAVSLGASSRSSRLDDELRNPLDFAFSSKKASEFVDVHVVWNVNRLERRVCGIEAGDWGGRAVLGGHGGLQAVGPEEQGVCALFGVSGQRKLLGSLFVSSIIGQWCLHGVNLVGSR